MPSRLLELIDATESQAATGMRSRAKTLGSLLFVPCDLINAKTAGNDKKVLNARKRNEPVSNICRIEPKALAQLPFLTRPLYFMTRGNLHRSESSTGASSARANSLFRRQSDRAYLEAAAKDYDYSEGSEMRKAPPLRHLEQKWALEQSACSAEGLRFSASGWAYV